MTGNGPSILIVDDDEGDIELIQRYLVKGEWKDSPITVTHSAEAGMEQLRSGQFEIVLLDFLIGATTGLDFLRLLDEARLPSPPAILMITGQGNELTATRALKSGAVDYLPKTHLDAQTLEAAISDALKTRLQSEKESRYLDHLESMARTDALTGLYNRRALINCLSDELNRAARYVRPLSFMIFDLDHFKRVNDQFGHPAGDEVLVKFASLLKASIRKTDSAGRLGGEEFCLILPETLPDQASVVAEKIRESLEAQIQRLASGDTFQVTCSIGVTGWVPEEPLIDEQALARLQSRLYDQADSALYEAKGEGRNRVIVRSILPVS